MTVPSPQPANGHPLFITRFGLSDRTAIGVQTRQILTHFAQHRHLYWNESFFDKTYVNSTRIESLPFARLPFLKRARQGWRAMKFLSKWDDEKPAVALAKALVRLRQTISTVYFAPIDEGDARRMQAMAEILRLPFVVHFWDFPDDLADPAMLWLVRNARHCFFLNNDMRRVYVKEAKAASLLPFIRPSTAAKAHFNSAQINIALMGEIGAYSDGVRCLIEAVQILRETDKRYHITYIGPAKALRRNKINDCAFIRPTGFISSPTQRDETLAGCMVGFLPGPLQDPSTNSRSRFSIPSRVLDFIAIGLPLVGTVHPDSATSAFCRQLNISTGLITGDAEKLAQALASLADENIWNLVQEKSLQAVDHFSSNSSIEEFRAALT